MSQATPPCSAPSAAGCDVLDIGGGPPGGTVAALLARRGRDMGVVQKARPPSVPVGGTLLPAHVTLFERQR